MENNETKPVVSSVALEGLDEATHDAQPSLAGASADSKDLPAQVHGAATNFDESGVTKGEQAQVKQTVEVSSEDRETSADAKVVESTSASAPSSQSYIPPVKRFSAVNINKKFLQKNQSLSSVAGSSNSSIASSNKQTGAIARPSPQTAQSHSRLVTAKLTATPVLSSAGQGWSRPNSVPPPAPSPTNTSGLPRNGITAPPGGHVPPQLAPPPGGKIIHPQARSVLKVDGMTGSGRPAWRSVQSGTADAALQALNDFPTAAEAAKGHLIKVADLKVASDATEAQKHAMSETADAFRGVHLDPNAHHWDEMEEDDNDDFLGGVIEFGDGRQYTIQVDDGNKVDSLTREKGHGPSPANPVTKEERFVDDFDRSWPKARHGQGGATMHDEHVVQNDSGRHSRASEASSNISTQSPASLRDGSQSRVLFNERLNRMEPYSNSRPGPGSTHAQAHVVTTRRSGPEAAGHVPNSRLERDAPPHSSRSQFQVLHKSTTRDFPQGQDESSRPHPFGESRREHDADTGSAFVRSSGDGVHHRESRREWGSPNASLAGTLPNGRPPSSREHSVSRGTANGASSVASSDDHSTKLFSSTRSSQHWGHAPSGHLKDLERQVPPHLMSSRAAPVDHPAPETDTRRVEQHAPLGALSEPKEGSSQESPSLEKGEGSWPEAIVVKEVPSVSPDDAEALRRAFLADSAERAKRRRQQEEEERAKAQERARKKAAELEEKMAVAKAAEDGKKTLDRKLGPHSTGTPAGALEPKTVSNRPTEAEVLNVIEEAIKSAAQPEHVRNSDRTAEHGGSDMASVKPHSGKTPASAGDDRLSATPDTHAFTRRSPFAPVSDQADSWRTRTKLPAPPAWNSRNDTPRDPEMARLSAVQAFDLQADESMEVIDFSDIGRLVGERTLQKANPTLVDETPGSPRPTRAVASDFFIEDTAEKGGAESWRRALNSKPHAITTDMGLERPSHLEQPTSEQPENRNTWPTTDNDYSRLRTPSLPNDSLPLPGHMAHVPTSPGLSRFLRTSNTAYREVPLSALDDTMSRIKVVIDGMHSSTAGQGAKVDLKELGTPSPGPQLLPALVPSQPSTSSDQPKREKWLPPALRPHNAEHSHKRTETFEFTRPEPPRSPAPPDNGYTIRVPRVSRPVEPLTRRQINFIKSTSDIVRWDILSFDPPVEGMTKRSLLVNDVLFRRPQGLLKNKKPRVFLPRGKRVFRQPAGDAQSFPKNSVQVGNVSKDGPSGAFGKSRMAGQGNWRNAPTGSSESPVNIERHAVLDITSRSPPPDLAPIAQAGHPSVAFGADSGRSAGKNKISLKSADGSDVAFYRDARKSVSVSSIPVVTFTVSSELEGETDLLPVDVSEASVSGVSEANSPKANAMHLVFSTPVQTSKTLPVNGALSMESSVAVQPSSPRGAENKLLEQQTDPLLRSHPATPPPQNTPTAVWKSPARVPDPEHLKAVWSQASDKGSLPTVNSLKGIADDLTAVPFTLQEVKSEGGTPPPSGPVAPPTRMSASEVTRAFQTVPSGPSNSMSSSSLRGNQLSSVLGSPMSTHRALKPTSTGLPPPSLNATGPRPHYMSYGQSISSHSPSPPTLIYSHVMPNGVPTSPAGSPYGQPVWMPLVHQQGPQMVRAQPPSPYSPSLMPYHVPGAQNGMFPPSNGLANPQSSPASYPSVPPSQMVVSPVLSHATPVPPHMMYAGSPMLVPIPPPGGAPQPRPYPGVVGMGRGSMPVHNHMDSRQHSVPGAPLAPASRFPVHNPGYTPVPPQSFVRPW
ncbi:hypothetical protein M0805_008333 [Coniferiporia weirii]|nr:hypothetical protein M0805_008333 [Coniferiporia weirii]